LAELLYGLHKRVKVNQTGYTAVMMALDESSCRYRCMAKHERL